MLNSGKTCFLAIDAGTTRIKAAIVSGDGRLLDISDAETHVLMPFTGACEMDPDEVWRQTENVLAALRARNPEAWKRVAGIGVCAQGDGCWMFDMDMRPVRNAVLWSDTRTRMDYEAANRICLSLDAVALFPGAAPCILKWMKKNEPDNYGRIAHVLHCKDFLNYRLTGRVCTDVPDASTSLLNIFTKRYAFEILDCLGIGEMRGVFPEVLESGEIIGGISGEAAAGLVLREGTPVICGAIDILAVATGCGLTRPGARGSIVGTTLANFVVLDEAEARAYLSGTLTGSILCHTRNGSYIRLMGANSGASSLDWVRREILNGSGPEACEAGIRDIPIGSGGVRAHPYLYGERAPFSLPTASGGFFGIRADHTKYHLARAAYEAVALSIRDCYDHMPEGGNTLVVAGGAARSDLLCQMICDCMGMRTSRFLKRELGILGIYDLLTDAVGFDAGVRTDGADIFTPDMRRNGEYMAVYQDYLMLRDAMMPYWEALLGREPAR